MGGWRCSLGHVHYSDMYSSNFRFSAASSLALLVHTSASQSSVLANFSSFFLVGLSAMRSGLARAERGGVHSLSTDCGLHFDGPITVSPYDPPPALLSGSRRLARLAGPTPARAWPTYLPLPESTNETSSPSRGQPPVRADSSRPPPAPSRLSQDQASRVAGAVIVKILVTPTRRHPSRGREGAPRGEAGGRGGGARTLLPWATG